MTGSQSTTLDELLQELYCLLDDRHPAPAYRFGRPRKISDTELVCLAIAQVLLDCPAERVWLRRLPERLGYLFPVLPSRAHYNKRVRALRARLLEALEILRELHPSTLSQMLLVDSTPVPVGKSLGTRDRSAMNDLATYGHCAAHHRCYWGFKLILVAAPDGFPISFELVPANTGETEALRTLLPRTAVRGKVILGDKGFASKALEVEIRDLGGLLTRPDKKGEKERFGSLAHTRQWIESVFATLKDQLSLERHGARTAESLTTRVLQRLLALAAALWHNRLIGQPGRHLTAYDH